MSKQKKLNCGVIGLGRVGKMHVENILTMQDINIVAVSDYFIDSISDWLDEIGIEKRTTDYAELLDIPEIEAVFIFTSTDTHEEIVTAAAKKGKHIFCEKPLSMSLDEESSLKVLRAVKENNVKLQMAFNRRFDPQFRNIYNMVRDNKIGEPQMVKITSRDPDLLPYDLIQRIGGLIFDFTMHDFDMARYMMGSDITEIYVKGNTLIDPKLKEIGDVDTLSIILEFENGAFGMIDNSRRAVYGYDQRVEVFGSEGMLIADNINASSVVYYNKDRVETKKPLPIFTERYREAYINEVNFFADSILNGAPIVCTGKDVFIAQQVAIAAQKSLELGQPVKVNRIPVKP